MACQGRLFQAIINFNGAAGTICVLVEAALSVPSAQKPVRVERLEYAKAACSSRDDSYGSLMFSRRSKMR